MSTWIFEPGHTEAEFRARHAASSCSTAWSGRASCRRRITISRFGTMFSPIRPPLSQSIAAALPPDVRLAPLVWQELEDNESARATDRLWSRAPQPPRARADPRHGDSRRRASLCGPSATATAHAYTGAMSM
jgi:hypothetical protein